MTEYKKGSQWHKWDLHIHSPLSIYQNYGGDTDETWEKFIYDLESLPSEFKVIGINDYLFLSGYKKVLQYKKKGHLKNIDLILPVLEFRLSELAGVEFGKYAKPNLHIIFSNEIPIKDIESQFLATLDSKYKIEPTGKPFQRSLDINSLKELGEQLINSAPKNEKAKYSSPLIEGFNNLTLSLEQIQDSLEKDCFKGKHLTAIGKTEWSAIKWTNSSIATKRHLINSCDIVFISSNSCDEYNNAKQKLTEQKVNNLLLDCSDAHSLSTTQDKQGNSLKDRIGNCKTWIKAELTFEGLKQIIYEPKYRVYVGERPVEPIKYIDKFKMNLEKNVKITVGDKNETAKFCFSDYNNKQYQLSKFFNCFIGGRGAGKSTLLSMMGLHAENRPIASEFWKEKLKPVNFNPENENCFNLNFTGRFVYLGQSEVEKLTDNPKELTGTIYLKISSDNQYRLQKIAQQINENTQKLEFTCNHIDQFLRLSKEKKEVKKELDYLTKLFDTTNNETLSKIKDKIAQLSTLKSNLETSHRKHTNLINSLQEVINKIQTKDKVSIKIEDIIELSEEEKISIEQLIKAANTTNSKTNTLVIKLNDIISEYSTNSENIDQLSEKLNRIIENNKNTLSSILKKLSINDGDLNELKEIPAKLNVLKQKLNDIENNIKIANTSIDENPGIYTILEETNEKYNASIKNFIEGINQILIEQSENNTNVKPISLTYSINTTHAWETIADTVYNKFSRSIIMVPKN